MSNAKIDTREIESGAISLLLDIEEILENRPTFEIGLEEEIKMVSWPFSRKLITTICINKGIEIERQGINKRFEKFIITGANFNDSIDLIIKRINKQARLMEGSFYKNRNIVTDNLLNKMYDKVPEVRLKTTPKKASTKKKVVKESEDIVIESLESLSKTDIAKLNKEEVLNRLSMTSLNTMEVEPLRAIAKHFEVKGGWKMRKEDLINEITEIRENA